MLTAVLTVAAGSLGAESSTSGQGWRLTPGWLLVFAIVLVLVVAGVIGSRREVASRETRQHAQQEQKLKARLGDLHDCVYYQLCVWLAENSQGHQRALEDAIQGVFPAQAIEGDD